jgi:hypothetical protein
MLFMKRGVTINRCVCVCVCVCVSECVKKVEGKEGF